MTPEHTDMTGAARLREALERTTAALARMPDAGLAEGDPRYRWWYDEAAPALAEAREALAAVPEGPSPPAHDCEAELKARPDYDQFRGTPAGFACSCGAQFVCCDDEAEGVCWERVEEGTER